MGNAKKKDQVADLEEAQWDDEAVDVEAIQEIAAETLVGDVRDVILDTIKHEKENKAWAQMTEIEQNALISRSTGAAELLVKKTVDLIASQGFQNAKAEIDSWKVKGRQVVITLKTAALQQNVLSLLNAGGNFVTLTFANDSAFDQSRSQCKAEPDQGSLLNKEDEEEIEADQDAALDDKAAA